jgi:hypothetical protein
MLDLCRFLNPSKHVVIRGVQLVAPHDWSPEQCLQWTQATPYSGCSNGPRQIDVLLQQWLRPTLQQLRVASYSSAALTDPYLNCEFSCLHSVYFIHWKVNVGLKHISEITTSCIWILIDFSTVNLQDSIVSLRFRSSCFCLQLEYTLLLIQWSIGINCCTLRRAFQSPPRQHVGKMRVFLITLQSNPLQEVKISKLSSYFRCEIVQLVLLLVV